MYYVFTGQTTAAPGEEGSAEAAGSRRVPVHAVRPGAVGMAVSTGTRLKPAPVSMLQTPQQLLSGEQTEYGFGWMLETFPLAGGPTRLARYGSRRMLGSSSWFLTFPERGIVVAVMSNTSLRPRRIKSQLSSACLHERSESNGVMSEWLKEHAWK